ncbi:MAG: sugar ABC transporter substrate-binding protein [Rhodobacter sp.]|nr:sugar ABC transporter substrate-binding protein [Rhodobacter sp.]
MTLGKIKMSVATAIATVLLVSGASAQDTKGTKASAELKADYDGSVVGKRIAYLPIMYGSPLALEWGRVLQREAEHRGIIYELRDPNSNVDAQLQALKALIDSQPDVIVVQNPSVTLLMRDLKRAEEQGIHVIQVNMASNYRSDAFVGVDWREIGRMIGEDVVKECGAGSGKSGKVAVVQGEITAAGSIDQMAGINAAFAEDPSIEIVSNQAGNWLADTAKNLTDVVIQQHPDLCAHIGFWGLMQSGAAQAIRNAGKIDDVIVYASGAGSVLDCDQINQGNFDKYLSYTGTVQGHALFNAALSLLQGDDEPGEIKRAYYTRPVWLDASNADAKNCFPLDEN